MALKSLMEGLQALAVMVEPPGKLEPGPLLIIGHQKADWVASEPVTVVRRHDINLASRGDAIWHGI